MNNPSSSNTASQSHHKKKWKTPTIEIINAYDIESGNITSGPEGLQFYTHSTFFRWEPHS